MAKVLKMAKPPRDQAAPLDEVAAKSHAALRPTLNAALVIDAFIPSTGLDMTALVEGLIESTQAMLGGDTDRAEAMLFSQANTLQAISTGMALRAAQNPYSRDFETFMRISLKAQNQSRMTLETLHNVRNPRVVIAQTNIAGVQQVNNGTSQNKLSGDAHELRQDTRASTIEGRADPTMETVGAVQRAEVRRR